MNISIGKVNTTVSFVAYVMYNYGGDLEVAFQLFYQSIKKLPATGRAERNKIN